jgi:hypothetical protein
VLAVVVVVVIALSTVALPVADGVVETVPSEETVVVVVTFGAVAATVPAVATVDAIFCCSRTILVAYAVA